MIKPSREKKHLSYTLEELYKLHLEANPKYKKSKKDFKRISHRVLYLISKAIIQENYTFMMPYKLGRIGIIKRDSKKHYPMDYGTYNKTGKLMRHLNRHSDWSCFRFKWDKRSPSHFRHSQVYSFKPIKDEKNREVGKRGLAQWIQDCAEDPYRKNFDALYRLP